MVVELGFKRTGTRLETEGATGATSLGTTVTTSGSTNTKGSYAQLVASSTFAAKGFVLSFQTNTTANREWLFDIALGAAASEIDIISNFQYSTAGATNSSINMYFPIPIPAGSRISMRGQSATASQGANVTIVLIAAGEAVASSSARCETCGANTANSQAVSLDPGGVSANTKGAYGQLIASTAFAYRYLIVSIGNQGSTTRSAISWLIDISVGAAASEIVVVADLPIRVVANACVSGQWIIPVEIPAGSRIVARCQASATTATQRLISCEVIGIG